MTLQSELERAADRLKTRALLDDPRIMWVRQREPGLFNDSVSYSLRSVPGFRAARLTEIHMRVATSLLQLARHTAALRRCNCERCRVEQPVLQVQTEFGLTCDSSSNALAIAADRLEDIGGQPDIVALWRQGTPFRLFDLSNDIRRLPEYLPLFIA